MSNKHHYGDPEVANPWDNGQEPTDPLPNSELNPLLNPTLGRNLGRWAQVYYTNPPEKREEAVGELLRQLENEDPGIGITEAPRAERLDANSQAELFCGTCQFKNEANQRFCGHCGSPLPAGSALSVRAGGEAFGERHEPGSRAPQHPAIDVQRLRDMALLSLKEPEAPAHHGWKYLIVALAILLAGFTYLRWAAQPQRAPINPASAEAQRPPALPPQLPAAEPAQNTRQQPPPEQVPRAEKAATARTTATNTGEKPPETSLVSPAQKLSAAADSASVFSSQAGVGAEGGSQELLLAQRYLDGKDRRRDTSEAAKWLWKAVGKQNAGAALMLADLYARGDGVRKSCDQARLLLVAAVKQRAPQAAQKLRSLQANGCQ
ncbi:MAG TPA: hypothetical protein VJK29_06145 [Terriglobales bacterium]|nr:hypothetical protein [Terriglobales bacterium]